MKFSSFLIVILVIAVFSVVQWWIVSAQFLAPKTLATLDAQIQGMETLIGTPVSGIVLEVAAMENQRVTTGQRLFIIVPQSPTQPQGGEPLIITARKGGIVTDIGVTTGTFVKTNDPLARIIDTNPDALFIEATLPVKPGDLPYVKPSIAAKVTAPFLNRGRPVAAVVTSVDPQYDRDRETIDVRLRLLEFPSELAELSVGVPVEVVMEIENRNRVKDILQGIAKNERVRGILESLASLPISFSNAQQQ